METYNGHVRTPQDAIILFEACRIGLLPRVQRRLSEKERQQIKSGSVFVWDEREAGMRRWTDGKSWSASRVSGSFLTYREMEGKRGGSGFQPPKKSANKSVDASRQGDHSSEGEEGPDGYRYKPDGLMKQSFSITTNSGQHLHLISYYARSNAPGVALKQPSNDQTLRSIRPAKGMYPESSINETTNVPAVTRSPMPDSPYPPPPQQQMTMGSPYGPPHHHHQYIPPNYPPWPGSGPATPPTHYGYYPPHHPPPHHHPGMPMHSPYGPPPYHQQHYHHGPGQFERPPPHLSHPPSLPPPPPSSISNGYSNHLAHLNSHYHSNTPPATRDAPQQPQSAHADSAINRAPSAPKPHSPPATNGYKPPTPPPTVSESRSQTSESLQVPEQNGSANGTTEVNTAANGMSNSNGATTPTSKMAPTIAALINTNSSEADAAKSDNSRAGSKTPPNGHRGGTREIDAGKLPATSEDKNVLRRLDKVFTA
ncbi:hypothetical protein K402DRAFT_422946 [Aulographum hederae CBS 113979]|uniref:cAMP-independent regulatory protein pac2 n=1 Tax=Aulographum hederae CBS 113979 TaxID=1176131 RepID=A0A6G1GTZ7_9PEZI|nr:hypothetical protein K402DRAFT_422946 [Aulographum hederae CBS 113979]